LKIAQIFRPQGPRTAAALAKALQDATTARRQAAAKLRKLAAARAEALLMSSDEEIDRIEAEQTAVARELDRLDAALAELNRRLPLAEKAEKAEARAKVWGELQRRYDGAADAFQATAEILVEQFGAVIAINCEAMRAGFAPEMASAFTKLPVLPGGKAVAIGREILDRFKNERARIADIGKPKAAAEPAPAPAPRTVKKAHFNPATGPLVPETPAREAPRAHLVIDGPIEPGHVAIQYQKAGVQLPGRGGLDGFSRLGDQIAVPERQANELVRNGAAVFAEIAPGIPSNEGASK
jgi:hypothetical protein